MSEKNENLDGSSNVQVSVEVEVDVDVDGTEVSLEEVMLIKENALKMFPGLTEIDETCARPPPLQMARKHSLMYPLLRSRSSMDGLASPFLTRGDTICDMDNLDEKIFDEENDGTAGESPAKPKRKIKKVSWPATVLSKLNDDEETPNRAKRVKTNSSEAIEENEEKDEGDEDKDEEDRNQSSGVGGGLNINDHNESEDDELAAAGLPPIPPKVSRRESWKDPNVMTGSWRVF